MKKRASLLIAICVIAMMLFASTSVFAAAPFEGSGTESDPYLIQNYEDLCKLSELVLIEEGGYASAHYLQTANIVANEGTFSLAKDGTPLYNGTEITLIYEKYDEYDEYGHIVGAKEVDLWQPIEYFNGSYDGGGFYISGIYVETGIYDDAGFILHTESAKISNFHLKNSVIRNSHKDSGITGGITAYAYSSEFKNCTVNAFVTNYHQTGSICSDATGCAFTNCINEGTVTTINRTDTATSSGYCGGICGKASYCEITSCENNGTVVGDTNVGGICGTLTDINKTIAWNENNGTVSGMIRVGGIGGTVYNNTDENIYANINTGNIDGRAIVGGIFGQFTGYMEQAYNTGKVSVTEKTTYYYNLAGCGGICGTLHGTIAACINDGKVENKQSQLTGGICGGSSGTIIQCANYGEVTSASIAGGILGKTLETGIVAYSYNAGDVTAKGITGGILGDIFTGWYGELSRYYKDENYVFSCYNVGNVKSSSGYAGGVAGSQINYTVDNCYYLNTTAAKAVATDLDSTAVTKAMTASEMKQKSFVPALNAGENIFKYDDLNENDGYPILIIFSEMPFADVAADAYYFDPVLWAVENGITNGMGDGTFGSDRSCTRGQFVTFLWRAAGCPEATDTTCAFTDCDPNQYYYPAVLWAVENGVTNGTSATTFSPDKTVNRAEVITFLWKYDGKPTISGSEPFTDVNENDWFYDAVKWGYANGLAKGMTDTTYGSMGNCTRAQTVTFLYRYFAE